MAEKPKEAPKTDILKGVVVMIIIWLAFVSLVFSNANIRKFFSSFGSKPSFYQDVMLVSSSENAFNGAKFYYDKRPAVNDVARSLSNPKTFFAATDYGIFISYDNGLDWYHINLPKEIGAATPVSRIFSNPQNYSQFFILILNGTGGTIYATSDNFSSMSKSFEITSDTAKKILNNRSISTIVPFGDKFMIGTK